MKVLKFEMKKLFRQKKFYWLLAVILIFSSGLFIQNKLEQEGIQDRAREEIRSLKEDTDAMGEEMRVRQLEDDLSDLEEKQYDHLKAMSLIFFQWKSAIAKEEWGEIPAYEKDFLTNLKLYEEYGGDFDSLQGIEREKAIAKNNWMIKKDLAYEDETYPTSPHLILSENVYFLLGIFGIVFLVLLFGNAVTAEKEQNTWHMLNTQPIPKWKLLVWKYMSMLLPMIIYLIMVIGIAMIIPTIFGDYSLNLLYPQIVTSSENFAVISTFQYIGRAVVLFISASAIVFSLVVLISKLMKSSFTALVMAGFILIIGFVLTDTFEAIQSVWNPLQSLRMGSIIDTIPQSTDWLYPVIALIWSSILLLIAVYLPNKEFHIFSSSQGGKPFQKGITRKKGKALWSSIWFEWRKTSRRGLLLQISIVAILLLIFSNLVLSYQADENEQYYINALTNSVDIYEDHLVFLEESFDRSQEKAADEANRKVLIQQSEQFKTFYEENISLIIDAIKAHEQGDWIPLYKYQLRESRLSNGELLEMHLKSPDLSPLTLEASITEKKWLLEHNIQPIYYLGRFETMYDPGKSSDGKGGSYTNKVDASGLYSLYYYLEKYIYLLPMMLILFLVGGGFSDERGKMDTIRFLRTEPITMKNLFNGKVAHSILISLISSIGFILIVILIGTVFDRFGDWYYPILHYDSESIVEAANYAGNRPYAMSVGYHFIPLGKILIRNMMLFICMVIFLVTLSQTLSIWLKNKFSVIASTILLAISGFILSTEQLVNKAHLIPFTYFDISRITNGELATSFDNPAINTQTGVVILLISTVVLLFIGNLSLRKQS